VQDEIELVLQVNGKLRGAIRCRPAPTRPAIEQAALASEAFVKPMAHGAKVRKVIVVPGRLVNVVI
jgi:leucyl-tRNA synthetase